MRLFYLISFCLVVLCACQPPIKSADTTRLLFSKPGVSLHVSPARLTVETPITFTLNGADIKSVQAELTGVNMYMGRVPVKFSQTAGSEWQAVFLLGACSEPDMKWQLVLQLTDIRGNKRQLSEILQVYWQ